MTDLRDKLVDAAIRFEDARMARIAAREAVRKYRDENGHCDGQGDDDDRACYHIKNHPLAEWCDVCRGSQPLWIARRLAEKERASALRAISARVRALRADDLGAT